MRTSKVIPHSGPVFEAMMVEIDASLMSEGHEIAARPMLAVMEVGSMYQIPIPIAGAADRLPAELKLYAPLSDAIYQWYRDTYGDRLKVDMTLGRAVFRLRRDLYVLIIPRIRGDARFWLSRQFLPEIRISRGPVDINIVQLIEDITMAKATQLSDSDLEAIDTAFRSAFEALYTLDTTPHDLMRIARGDIATAVNCLMQRTRRFGESKWASLQAAEKVLKAAISLQGVNFKHTHRLEVLCSELEDSGISTDLSDLIRPIQCTPDIRYGKEACDQDQALAAHEASLALVNRLREAGAKFESGLG